jgi:hypothetical protein
MSAKTNKNYYYYYFFEDFISKKIIFQNISKMFQIDFFFSFYFIKVILFERKIKIWENFHISPPPPKKKTIQFLHQSHQGRGIRYTKLRILKNKMKKINRKEKNF